MFIDLITGITVVVLALIVFTAGEEDRGEPISKDSKDTNSNKKEL